MRDRLRVSLCRVFRRRFPALQLVEDLIHNIGLEEGPLAPATVAALEAEGFSLTVLPFRTTAENLARYVAGRLSDQGLPISEVECYETPNNCAIWHAD